MVPAKFPQSKTVGALKIRGKDTGSTGGTCGYSGFFAVSKSARISGNRGHQNDRCRLVTVEGKRMQGRAIPVKLPRDSKLRMERAIHTETLGNQYNFDGGQYRGRMVQSQGKRHMPDLRYFCTGFSI